MAASTKAPTIDEVELAAFVAEHARLRLVDGRNRVVRCGHAPTLTIQTSIGPPVRSSIQPKLARRTTSLEALFLASGFASDREVGIIYRKAAGATMANDTQENLTLAELITSDPEVLGGRQVFRGTRVPIEVLFENLADGMSIDEILDQYGTLNRDDIVRVLELTSSTLSHPRAA